MTTLGYDKSEIPEHIAYQLFTDKQHPEDCQKVMESMRDHLYGKGYCPANRIYYHPNNREYAPSNRNKREQGKGDHFELIEN